MKKVLFDKKGKLLNVTGTVDVVSSKGIVIETAVS